MFKYEKIKKKLMNKKKKMKSFFMHKIINFNDL